MPLQKISQSMYKKEVVGYSLDVFRILHLSVMNQELPNCQLVQRVFNASNFILILCEFDFI